MSNKPTVTVTTTSPLFLLFLVFLVLKLTGHITWSWWCVTAPLWGGVALFFAIALMIIIPVLFVTAGHDFVSLCIRRIKRKKKTKQP
jgi:hypothetical protein